MRLFGPEGPTPQDTWAAVYEDLRIEISWAPPGVYECVASKADRVLNRRSLDYPHLVIEWLAKSFQEYPSEAQPPPLS